MNLSVSSRLPPWPKVEAPNLAQESMTDSQSSNNVQSPLRRTKENISIRFLRFLISVYFYEDSKQQKVLALKIQKLATLRGKK